MDALRPPVDGLEGLRDRYWRGPPPTSNGCVIGVGRFVRRYFEEAQVEPPKARLLFSVELTGFELVTPSLRKMWSKPPDQGF